MIKVSTLRGVRGKKFQSDFCPEHYTAIIEPLSDTTSKDMTRLCTDPDYLFDALMGQINLLTSTCAAYQSGTFDNTDISVNYGGLVAELENYCALLVNAFNETDTGAILAIADFIVNNM